MYYRVLSCIIVCYRALLWTTVHYRVTIVRYLFFFCATIVQYRILARNHCLFNIQFNFSSEEVSVNFFWRNFKELLEKIRIKKYWSIIKKNYKEEIKEVKKFTETCMSLKNSIFQSESDLNLEVNSKTKRFPFFKDCKTYKIRWKLWTDNKKNPTPPYMLPKRS